MLNNIHITAIVDNSAKVDPTAVVGPYCVVGSDVVLHAGVRLISHVCIDGHTEIDENTTIFPFSSIGFMPQDLKFHGEKSKVYIGKRNVIREYVTIHPGTEGGIMETRVGDDCLLMAHVHIAHDCIIGDGVIMANASTLAGHVTVQDHAFLGGLSAVHQHVRIGELAMVGGVTGVEKDVIPFGCVYGNRAKLVGLNLVGLKRSGTSIDEISELKRLYNSAFLEDACFNKRISLIDENELIYEKSKKMLTFLKAQSNRSFCLPEHGL